MIKLLAYYIMTAHFIGVVIDLYLLNKYGLPEMEITTILHAIGMLIGLAVLRSF